ncbi:MAG: hypothetical protein GXO54_04675 [Chloroflexi bacterium]|nr:hypothetical protein [Chloroflexota bacterium]
MSSSRWPRWLIGLGLAFAGLAGLCLIPFVLLARPTPVQNPTIWSGPPVHWDVELDTRGARGWLLWSLYTQDAYEAWIADPGPLALDLPMPPFIQVVGTQEGPNPGQGTLWLTLAPGYAPTDALRALQRSGWREPFLSRATRRILRWLQQWRANQCPGGFTSADCAASTNEAAWPLWLCSRSGHALTWREWVRRPEDQALLTSLDWYTADRSLREGKPPCTWAETVRALRLLIDEVLRPMGATLPLPGMPPPLDAREQRNGYLANAYDWVLNVAEWVWDANPPHPAALLQDYAAYWREEGWVHDATSTDTHVAWARWHKDEVTGGLLFVKPEPQRIIAIAWAMTLETPSAERLPGEMRLHGRQDPQAVRALLEAMWQTQAPGVHEVIRVDATPPSFPIPAEAQVYGHRHASMGPEVVAPIPLAPIAPAEVRDEGVWLVWLPQSEADARDAWRAMLSQRGWTQRTDHDAVWDGLHPAAPARPVSFCHTERHTILNLTWFPDTKHGTWTAVQVTRWHDEPGRNPCTTPPPSTDTPRLGLTLPQDARWLRGTGWTPWTTWNTPRWEPSSGLLSAAVVQWPRDIAELHQALASQMADQGWIARGQGYEARVAWSLWQHGDQRAFLVLWPPQAGLALILVALW